MSPKARNELTEDMSIPLRFSNNILSQFDGARISPYALGWARMVCAGYTLSLAGERTYNNCLNNLPVFVAADDRLQFGWNELCLYRNVGLHNFEYEHLLLTSALTECLPNAYCAAVLSHLGSPFEDGLPGRNKPSIRAFRDLMGSTSGILMSSDFGLVLDDRMRLDPYRVISGHTASRTNSLVPPVDFARALSAIVDLVAGKSFELVLVGGNFLAWFAAAAELFFGLNVQITSRDGTVLHTSRTDHRATLKLIFTDGMNGGQPLTLPGQTAQALTLAVMCTHQETDATIPRIPFTGRVNWETLLPKVFEDSFHKIAHQHFKSFCRSVGGAANLFKNFVQHPEVAPKSAIISVENRANPAAWGVGLVQTICNWFPELRHLQGRLERLQSGDMQEAGSSANTGAHELSALCGCTICEMPPYLDGLNRKMPESFCLLAIMETILALGLAMSRIVVTSKLYPSRAGVLCIYQRQCQKLLQAKQSRNDDDAWARGNILFGSDWNANYSRRLQNAAAFFTGTWPEHDMVDNLVAISHEGVCVYALELQKGNLEPLLPRDAGVIQVTSGHIAWKQKNFSRATLGPPVGISDTDYSWEELKCRHLSQSLYCK